MNRFKYLGFMITSAGGIKAGLEDLRDRAMRAFYKLKGAMGESFRTHVGVALHLLDSLVKPILMYMSDFWGGTEANRRKIQSDRKISLYGVQANIGCAKADDQCGRLAGAWEGASAELRNKGGHKKLGANPKGRG